MSVLAERLASGRFIVTAELDPPRGADVAAVMDKVALLVGHIDALNVTDSPRAHMRMSPIALAHMVVERFGMETVFHLTCRDRNVIGLQSELLGAAALGVRNILALSGDTPQPPAGPEQTPSGILRGVYEVDSLGLVRIASALNSGRDVAGRRLNAPTAFCIGVGANPNAADLGREADRVLAKIELGAHFVQTQPVYDIETFSRFAERLRPGGTPLIAGVLVPRTAAQLVNVIAKVPGVSVPAWFERAVVNGGQAEAVRLLGRMVRELPGLARGVHIMPMGSPEAAIQLASVVAAMRGTPAGHERTASVE